MKNKQTLDQLINGQLAGSREIRLTHLGLKEFPLQILELADSLELLDLSGNQLSHLPDEIALLKKLKIVFFSDNCFEVFPDILSQLPHLEMVGFKANAIHTISEQALPPQLRWLILTQNKITSLPKSIGNKIRLQKLMLAGNNLASLPEEMQQCTNLELLRISANQFESIPDWIWNMPRLSWLAYASNPLKELSTVHHHTHAFHWQEFEILNQLGEGASGVICKAKNSTRNKEVALKIFKGDVTSDGLPISEMQACIHAGIHPNLIPVLGNIDAHPEGKDGLVMELLPLDFTNLGLPPNFETCTRDVYSADQKFTINTILKIVIQIANCCAHLHLKGIAHGDIYAHNILINHEFEAILGDFGAATCTNLSNQQHEHLEVRAWACLLEDLLQMAIVASDNDRNILEALHRLQQICFYTNPSERPTFREIEFLLNNLTLL